jgi:hypothetical protein
MEKLEWCCIQKFGIKLVEPSENIGTNYQSEAEDDFLEMKNTKSLKWKNITAYYSCYNAIYSILQKIGIKCEIHECSIELFKDILKEINFELKEDSFAKLINLKGKRIGVQYYLEKPENVNEKEIADFILTCKQIYSQISKKDITDIRKHIQEVISNANKPDKKM